MDSRSQRIAWTCSGGSLDARPGHAQHHGAVAAAAGALVVRRSGSGCRHVLDRAGMGGGVGRGKAGGGFCLVFA
eukprot:364815-Chlamydomonas_euryale.AAC.4